MTSNNVDQTQNPSYSNKKIIRSSLVALCLAAVVLVLIVLPAEYDIDYFGTGKALGLTGLSTRQQHTSFAPQVNTLQTDEKVFILMPFESLEYKYSMTPNDSMVFHWSASDEVISDFHAENPIDEKQTEKSYRSQRSLGFKAAYTAEFSGIHGWYWENRNLHDVQIRLSSSGFYQRAQEFRDGSKSDHQLIKINHNQ